MYCAFVFSPYDLVYCATASCCEYCWNSFDICLYQLCTQDTRMDLGLDFD